MTCYTSARKCRYPHCACPPDHTEPDAQTQQSLAQGFVGRGYGGKAGEGAYDGILTLGPEDLEVNGPGAMAASTDKLKKGK